MDFLSASRAIIWLGVLAMAGATARVLLRSLSWPLALDAPLMHYIAVQMLHGAVPYRDTLDMNMPGTYWIHEAVVATLGTGDRAWRMFDLFCLAAICATAAGILRRAGSAACALGVVILVAWHLDAGPTDMGQRDFMAVIPLMIAALASIRFMETTSRRDLVVAGVAIGLATLIKPTGVLVPALVMPALFASGRREPRTVVLDALSVAAAMLAVLSAVAIILAAEGALIPFIAGWREFILPVYSKLHDAGPTVLTSAGYISVQLLPCLLLIAGSWVFASRSTNRPVHFILAAFAVWGFMSFVLQGRGWPYHAYPWAMFTIVWAAAALGDLLRAERASTAYVAAALLVCSAPAMVLHHGQLFGGVADVGYVPFARFIARDLARFIQPGDEVQTLDTTDGAIHALLILGVKQPTPFIYDWMLLGDGDTPFRQSARARFLAELEANPPKAIVITNQQWPEPSRGYRRVGSWNEFNALLLRSYKLESMMRETPKTPHSRGYLIYVRNR